MPDNAYLVVRYHLGTTPWSARRTRARLISGVIQATGDLIDIFGQTPRKCFYILGTAGSKQNNTANYFVLETIFLQYLAFSLLVLGENVKKINSAALFLQNLVTSVQDYGKLFFFSIYCHINSANQFRFWKPSSPVPPFSSPLYSGSSRVSIKYRRPDVSHTVYIGAMMGTEAKLKDI